MTRNIIRAADFSMIEARVVAWLAGEQPKLEMFKAYDAKTGPDPYRVSAAGIFSVPVSAIDKEDPRRQVGKVSVLALGFQGGVGAFIKMSKTYNVDIGEAYETVYSAASAFNIERAEDAWDQRGKRSGIAQHRWLAAELVKLAWRDDNPMIVQLWKDVEAAAMEAVENPGMVTHAGEFLRFRKAGSWLLCRLPNGRAIAYAYPRIIWKTMPWNDSSGKPAKRPALAFQGVNSFTKKWSTQDYYGGLGVQNATQGTARDVMADAMVRAEAAGYGITMTVHDELVTESPSGKGSLDEFSTIIAQAPSWAPGLPVTAEAWEGPRYRK